MCKANLSDFAPMSVLHIIRHEIELRIRQKQKLFSLGEWINPLPKTNRSDKMALRSFHELHFSFTKYVPTIMIFDPIFTSTKHKINYTTLTQISRCIQISGSICKRSTRIQTKKLITVKNTKPTFANFMRHEFFYSFKTQGSL